MNYTKIGSKSILILFLISYFLFLISPPAFAQEPDYDRINKIAENLNCPTCVGINLADCNTLTCEQWRNQINDLVTQGYNDAEVLDYFATRYGAQVLQEPPKNGSTLFLWILPVVALLAGGIWLMFSLRYWAKSAPATIPQVRPVSASPHPPAPYLSQVEKDLNLGD